MQADAPASGTIHDIGYRHYDGPRLGRHHAATSLLWDGVKGSFGFGRSARAKIAPLLLLAAACIPALVMTIIIIFTGTDSLTGGYLGYVEYVQFLVSIFIAVLAPALVSRDLRYRILSLYFSRPMHRIDYVLAKLGAAAIALFVFMAVPLIVLLSGSLLAKLSVESQLPDFLRAMGASIVLALLLAGIGVFVAALAPRRGMGVAAIITVLLMLSGAQGILTEIGSSTRNETLSTYAAMLSPYSIVNRIFASVLGAKETADSLDGALQIGVFAIGAIAIFGACFGLLLLRYRKVSVS